MIDRRIRGHRRRRAPALAIGVLGLLTSSLLAAAPSAASDFVAIVHPSNSVSKLSVSELRDFFLADRQKWAGGASVTPILPKRNTAALKVLREKVLRVGSEDDLAMAYMAAIFQQKITEPPPSASTASAIALVAKTPGGLAFVPRTATAGRTSIKVIEVDGL